MSTVSLDIWTGAYPTIAHDITIKVYAQSDPLAVLTSATHAPPHLADSWSFPGLARTNLLFRIFETNAGVVIQQLGDDMNVVPGDKGGVAFKTTLQIEADVTIGFASGVNSVIFDGTGGTDDWRGWDIATINRMGGAGVMKKGVDYTWNSVTGKLTLVVAGDLFGALEWFNVDFDAQITDSSSSVPASIPLFTTPKLITANYLVDAGADFGGLLIIDPAANYLELQLPDIDTVVPGRVLEIEMRRAGVNKCCKILTEGGQTIDWLAGGRISLYICPQESISLYRFIDTGPTNIWRVKGPNGNWLRLGESVEDDNIVANVFNKILLDGSSIDDQQFARLYNDYVLQLPGAQVVNYDNWTTGNNKYKFSLANSAIGGNAGKFKIPDRRGTFERNAAGADNPGDFEAQALQQHRHMNGVSDDKAFGDAQNIFVYGQAVTDMPNFAGGNAGDSPGNPLFQGFTSNTGGSETRPNNIKKRKYLLV